MAGSHDTNAHGPEHHAVRRLLGVIDDERAFESASRIEALGSAVDHVVAERERTLAAAPELRAIVELDAGAAQRTVLPSVAVVATITAAARKLERERVREERASQRAARKAELVHERLVKALAKAVFEGRKSRAVNPEGEFDKQGRWYPGVREDAAGSGSRTRYPSRAWPYSYMLRCRTREHSTILVERALNGLDVPSDVSSVVSQTPAAAEIRERALSARRILGTEAWSSAACPEYPEAVFGQECAS